MNHGISVRLFHSRGICRSAGSHSTVGADRNRAPVMAIAAMLANASCRGHPHRCSRTRVKSAERCFHTSPGGSAAGLRAAITGRAGALERRAQRDSQTQRRVDRTCWCVRRTCQPKELYSTQGDVAKKNVDWASVAASANRHYQQLQELHTQASRRSRRPARSSTRVSLQRAFGVTIVPNRSRSRFQSRSRSRRRSRSRSRHQHLPRKLTLKLLLMLRRRKHTG